ncbi:MAG: histidine phosphatase family protein [Candidatus Levybacteria bacterium]|nr:histidine phosphatase family protein [Candidatus Levybacteria bacterium]
MNTEVYLIRHGEVDNPQDKAYGSLIDVPLTAEGIEQIKILGREFKKAGIIPDVIYSSFHTRGIRSAEILREMLAPNIKLRQDDRLRDMDHPGLEKKYTTSDVVNKINDVWNYNWPSEDKNIPIEKREDMIERLTEVISEIVKANQGKNVFIIVHGHPSAFYIWSLLHPNEKGMPLPSNLIREGIYLKKGKARKLIFENSTFIESERFSKE